MAKLIDRGTGVEFFTGGGLGCSDLASLDNERWVARKSSPDFKLHPATTPMTRNRRSSQGASLHFKDPGPVLARSSPEHRYRKIQEFRMRDQH